MARRGGKVLFSLASRSDIDAAFNRSSIQYPPLLESNCDQRSNIRVYIQRRHRVTTAACPVALDAADSIDCRSILFLLPLLFLELFLVLSPYVGQPVTARSSVVP
ncbi:hypothetical protein Bbelb_248550 [Branchiostoma belcheri]|nr:hypothetical protein Bbelb_248550 [Branchiostoma belcheri]